MGIASKAILIYIGICIIYLIMVFFIVKLYLTDSLEKRLENFTVKAKENETEGFIDKASTLVLKMLKWISKIISKSSVMQKYAKYFSKYLIYREFKNLKNIDHMSIKVLIMLSTDIFYVLTTFTGVASFNLFVLIIVSFIAFMTYDVLIMYLFNKKKALLEDQLLQAVVVMNSAFKSGKNIFQAVDIVRKEMPSPIKEEFNIIAKDMSYGLDIQTVFNRFYDRIKLEEAKYITSSLSLLNKTGGNIVTVFNMIEKNFYDKVKIKNELNSMLSSSRLLTRALLVLPLLFILVIITLNPLYFKPLLSTKVGYVIDCIIAILYVIYIVLIKKVTKVKKV